MKLTYFILLHNNLKDAKCLIESLACDNVSFYVHVDDKCKENISILENVPNVYLAKKRHSVEWGGYSIIEALTGCCREIKEVINPDFVVLLSGTDYPVRSNSYILNYISRHINKDFIEGHQFPSAACHWLEGGRRRLECYALRLDNKNIATVEPRVFSMGNIRQLLKVIINKPTKVGKFFSIWNNGPRRRHPDSLIPYRGEMWWGLRMSTIDKVIDYVDNNPEFMEYHTATCIPDEIFFSTLVYNLIPQEEIENGCLRYINWNKTPGKSPMDVTMNDRLTIDKIIETEGYLFARKVNSPSVKNYINSRIK